MPFDLAFTLDDETRGAFAISFANFHRPKELQFDLENWSFPEPPK